MRSCRLLRSRTSKARATTLRRLYVLRRPRSSQTILHLVCADQCGRGGPGPPAASALFGALDPDAAWFVTPYVALWRALGSRSSEPAFWVITGDLPSDFVLARRSGHLQSGGAQWRVICKLGSDTRQSISEMRVSRRCSGTFYTAERPSSLAGSMRTTIGEGCRLTR